MTRLRWRILGSIARLALRGRRTGKLLCLAWLLASAPVLAWNAGGHRISALVAWRCLDRGTQAEVARLLRHHPDHARWVGRSPSEDADLAAFLEASTWPDDIRRDARFFTQGREEPTAVIAGFPDMERRLHWHFMDRPLYPSGRERPSVGVIDRQLVSLAAVVGDRRADGGARGYALAWLIHLVGDAHQPLHVGSRYSADGQSDGGGNEVEIDSRFGWRPGLSNLHRYWDDLPAPPWLRGSRLEEVAAELMHRYPPPDKEGGIAEWLNESWQIAREHGYPAGGNGVVEVSAAFHEEAAALARRRVTEAGYRLGKLLQRLLRY